MIELWIEMKVNCCLHSLLLNSRKKFQISSNLCKNSTFLIIHNVENFKNYFTSKCGSVTRKSFTHHGYFELAPRLTLEPFLM